MHKLLNKQISGIYSKRFSNYNDTPKGVFWNSSLSQDLRLNIILDKISDSGYDSLSKEEKKFLFKSGKK